MVDNGFRYETQGNVTFFVYTIQPGDVVDTMGFGMLTHNKIPGLAPTQYSQMDTERYIMYNVSAKIPVSQFFSGHVNRKRLIGVFKGIISALISAEDFMIDPNSILLDMDYIFTDVSSCDTFLICLPVQQKKPPVNLGQFFKNIMFSTQFDQSENCDYVAKIMNYLNSAPVFSASDFNTLLEQLQKESESATGSYSVKQPAVQQQMPQNPVSQPVQPPQQSVVQPQPVKNPEPMQPQENGFPEPQNFQPAAPQSAALQSFQVPGAPSMQIPQGTALPSQDNPVQQPLVRQAPEKQSFFKKLFKSDKGNKAQNAAVAPAMPIAQPPQKKKKKKNNGVPSFQVPGQQSGFAVPFQTNPVSAPAAGKKSQNPQGMPNERSGVQPSPTPQPAAQVAQQQPSYSAQPSPMQQPVYQSPVVPAYQAPAMPQNAQPQTTPMSFGETTVLGGGTTIGETTVLDAGAQKVQLHPHLVRAKNNERIDVNKPVFRIGKERSYVDYFISDNTAVSRSHANIVSRDGDFFIVDTNSTNHTYVNGGMILSNSETRLSHGAKIRLANEEFEFRLY